MSLDGTYDHGNIFAKILRGEAPAARVFEDDHVLAFMDVFPQARGHTLVIPKHSTARNLMDEEPQVLANVILGVQRVTRAVRAALNPDGIVVTQFNGAPAGQTVYHLHFHIIPRWEGVPLGRHAGGGMADPVELKALAEQIAAKIVTVSLEQAQAIHRIGSLVTYAYLTAVVALIARLEILRTRGALPDGVKTVFGPIPGPIDTWAALLGKNSRIRWGRLFRVLLTDEHMSIGDQWATMLVYSSRILLVASLGLTATDSRLGNTSRRSPERTRPLRGAVPLPPLLPQWGT